MKRLAYLLLVLILYSSSIKSQNSPKNYSLNGYLQTLEMIWMQDINQQWLTMNTVSNRLDFHWYPSDKIHTYVAMRNIGSYGQMPGLLYPMLADFSIKDNGKLNLTQSLLKDTSYFAYSNLDRAHIEYIDGNFELSVGRQRINWGINLLWTPNDIFNSFNFFDFDYLEKAGSDAIRMQYYTGMTSSVQFAIKMDRDDKLTYAGMYRFNKWNYDFQVLAGLMRDDIVIGGGWAGQIEGAGFTGEASYFKDKENFSDTTGVFVGALAINYTLKSGLFFQGAFLYNSIGTIDDAGQESVFALDLEISAKVFTRAKYACFAQVSYPLTPLIKADLSGIYNPTDHSAYVGPSFDFSLTDNINFMLMGQVFMGENGTEYGDYGAMFFTRLKWSF